MTEEISGHPNLTQVALSPGVRMGVTRTRKAKMESDCPLISPSTHLPAGPSV